MLRPSCLQNRPRRCACSTLWLANWDSGGACSQTLERIESSRLYNFAEFARRLCPATLAAETCALFVVSTHGEGEAPDPVQPFFQQLCVEHFPLLGDLSYAILALGDSHYEHFLSVRKESRRKLSGLGATCILPRTDSDVDVDAPFTAWKQAVREKVSELASKSASTIARPPRVERRSSGPAGSSAPRRAEHSRGNPYLSPLRRSGALTHPFSSKLTIHLDSQSRMRPCSMRQATLVLSSAELPRACGHRYGPLVFHRQRTDRHSKGRQSDIARRPA